MKKVSHNTFKVKTIHKADVTPQTPFEEDMNALDTHIALILGLALGLDSVAEELQQGVTRLAGQRYTRKDTQTPIGDGVVSKAECISLIKNAYLLACNAQASLCAEGT